MTILPAANCPNFDALPLANTGVLAEYCTSTPSTQILAKPVITPTIAMPPSVSFGNKVFAAIEIPVPPIPCSATEIPVPPKPFSATGAPVPPIPFCETGMPVPPKPLCSSVTPVPPMPPFCGIPVPPMPPPIALGLANEAVLQMPSFAAFAVT